MERQGILNCLYWAMRQHAWAACNVSVTGAVGQAWVRGAPPVSPPLFNTFNGVTVGSDTQQACSAYTGCPACNHGFCMQQYLPLGITADFPLTFLTFPTLCACVVLCGVGDD